MRIEYTRALLVEDNPADARLLKEAVAEVGAARSIELVHVDRLSTALQRLKEESFDVILLDLSLPDESGLQTLIRAHAAAPSVPIVVLTGLDDEALATRAVREGAQDYLVKGRVDGYLLVRAMRYATERKHAIEVLQRREEHFRLLIENALDLISITNSDGTIRYVSPSHERILGYRPDELIGGNLFTMVHPDDVEELSEAFSREASTESMECRLQHKNGSWRVLEAFARNLSHVPGVQGIVLNARDVTERKHAEEALREANQTLRAVFHTSPLAIYSTDSEGRVKSWNRAAHRIFGWAEWELLDNPLPQFPTELEDMLQARRENAERQAEFPLEQKCQRKDGSAIETRVWSAFLRDAAGAVRGIVDVAADITEIKRLEEQLHHSQRLDAIARLAGGIAHDFNNLLMVISGYSQMLRDALAHDEEALADMNQVIKAAERATDLTQQLLAFSRRQVVTTRILDLNALVRDMERMLQRVIGEGVRLTTELDAKLPRVCVDSAQIEQVLLNLAMNARDAMPRGGMLSIRTTTVEFEEAPSRKRVGPPPGHYVKVSISDTGFGIDPRIEAHLFEPFFTTKEKGKGTGLGLSTSYGIIKQSGGDITFTSSSAGTTFDIFLPVANEASELPDNGLRAQPQRGSETVLLVEDDNAVRHVIESMLKKSGYSVLPCASPTEALDVSQDRLATIDLLITDVTMPGLSGPQLVKEIRTIRTELPFLFISGYSDSLTNHIPGPYLQKPFTQDVLASKVREALRRNGV